MIVNTVTYLVGLAVTHRVAIAAWAFLAGLVIARTVHPVATTVDYVIDWFVALGDLLMLTG